jgi:hypothetical protein
MGSEAERGPTTRSVALRLRRPSMESPLARHESSLSRLSPWRGAAHGRLAATCRGCRMSIALETGAGTSFTVACGMAFLVLPIQRRKK